MPDDNRVKKIKGVDCEHPDYTKYRKVWGRCRTVVEGSEAVKKGGEEFLPRLVDQVDRDYEDYKRRALFFEGTTRTVNGLVGMMFAKEPILTQPEGKELLDEMFPDYISIGGFLKDVASEVLTIGRIGVLVDADNSGEVYIVKYKSEDIINWKTVLMKGKLRLEYVVLREEATTYEGFQRIVKEQFRVLCLDEEGKYKQQVYIEIKKEKAATDMSRIEEKEFMLIDEIYPTKSGIQFEEIPFCFINVHGLNPTVERPPLLGLVDVNVSHYMNSADLEHGRHFTGLPTPWVSGFNLKNNAKLSIGSHVAWVSSNADAKAGFLEFTGAGLSTLENALKEKQDMMVVLGARLLETPKNAPESAMNQTVRKHGENSVLANIAISISEGITKVVQTAAEWMREKGDNYGVEIHSEFGYATADSQLLAQLMAAIQGGLISFDTWFYNLQRAGIIPTGVTKDEEDDMIKARQVGEFSEQFPSPPGIIPEEDEEEEDDSGKDE